MKSLSVSILTPTRNVWTGQAETVVLPGAAGSFGVLAGHAVIVSVLSPGTLRLKPVEGAAEIKIEVGAGLAEVHHDTVLVLLDSAQTSDVPSTADTQAA